MEKFHKYIVLLALMLINCVISISLYFGNLSTYIYSLQYSYSHEDPESNPPFDIDPSVMLPVYLGSKTVGNFVVDFIHKRIGLKATSGLGILLFIISISLTYFTVSHSVWATTLTLMFGGGLANGVVSVCLSLYAALWFGSNLGLASGLAECSTAVGGVILNLVITDYINPGNLSPNMKRNNMRFFSQQTIIDNVPMVFIVIGGISAAFQVIGFFFLKNPTGFELPTYSQSEKEPLVKDSESSLQIKKEVVPPYTSFKSKEEKETSFSSSSSGDSDSPPEKQQQKLLSGQTNTKNDKITNLTPMQVLKSETYYILECITASHSLGIVVGTFYFKLFGQLWIHDDHFFAVTASTSSLCTIVFILGCGIMIDRLGLKDTIIAHLAASCFFLSLWYVTPQCNRWLYLAWTVVVYGVHNNFYILYTVSTLNIFGRIHFSTNFGLLQITSLLIYFLGPFIVAYIISSIGWSWLFFITACSSFFSLIVTMLRMPKC